MGLSELLRDIRHAWIIEDSNSLGDFMVASPCDARRRTVLVLVEFAKTSIRRNESVARVVIRGIVESNEERHISIFQFVKLLANEFVQTGFVSEQRDLLSVHSEVTFPGSGFGLRGVHLLRRVTHVLIERVSLATLTSPDGKETLGERHVLEPVLLR